MTKRDIGKLIFATLQDNDGKIQLILQKGENGFDFFKKYIDSGDFVGVSGIVMKTKTGEVSILVGSVELLSKSLLPLPEKFHGLKDEEDRLRKRYLDILMNPEVKEIFVKKSKFWNTIRKFLSERDFIEVE
jgi:lysyl-tRNA synthetase class 2